MTINIDFDTEKKLDLDFEAIIRDIIAALHNKPVDGRVYIDDEMLGRMEAYLKEYGAR